MALEFVLAVVSGLIVALVSSLIQHRNKPPDSLLEVTHRTEAVVHSTTFIDGTIVQQDTEIYIEESTFRLPSTNGSGKGSWISLLAGIAIFAAVLAVLLLLA